MYVFVSRVPGLLHRFHLRLCYLRFCYWLVSPKTGLSSKVSKYPTSPYPTWRKRKSSSNVPFVGDMLVFKRAYFLIDALHLFKDGVLSWNVAFQTWVYGKVSPRLKVLRSFQSKICRIEYVQDLDSFVCNHVQCTIN